MTPENHGKAWTEIDNINLTAFFVAGKSITELAELMERKPNAIITQLERLNLVRAYWDYNFGHRVVSKLIFHSFCDREGNTKEYK